MAKHTYRALNDWLLEYEEGVVRRMRWLGPTYGPPKPPDVRPAPCRQHDRLTFPCDECAAHALGGR
jgi:hypothetical protein